MENHPQFNTYFLDSALFYLGEDLEGNRFRLNLLETSTHKVLLLFTSKDLARQLFPGQSILHLAKDDFRAREDVFRAALEAGACDIWLDSLQPHIRMSVQQALNYTLSFKNQRACL